jgi:hypothetical protein
MLAKIATELFGLFAIAAHYGRPDLLHQADLVPVILHRLAPLMEVFRDPAFAGLLHRLAGALVGFPCAGREGVGAIGIE